jgi:hypothetical protein
VPDIPGGGERRVDFCQSGARGAQLRLHDIGKRFVKKVDDTGFSRTGGLGRGNDARGDGRKICCFGFAEHEKTGPILPRGAGRLCDGGQRRRAQAHQRRGRQRCRSLQEISS